MPYHPAAILIVLLFTPAVFAADAPVKIIAMGDSITRGVRPGVKAEETFCAYLQEGLKKKGLEADVVNAGIGSEDTRLALARLSKVLAMKPQVLAIMYGANDSFIPKGKKATQLTPEEFEANLRKIVAELDRKSVV